MGEMEKVTQEVEKRTMESEELKTEINIENKKQKTEKIEEISNNQQEVDKKEKEKVTQEVEERTMESEDLKTEINIENKKQKTEKTEEISNNQQEVDKKRWK